MKILLDKRDGHHRSIVALEEDAISGDVASHARAYLDSIEDFRGGMTSWGKAIPRLQKWYGNGYFGEHWKDQDNPRWMPCEYEPELLDIQELMQEKFDSCVVAQELGLTGVRRKCKRRGRSGRFKPIRGRFKQRQHRKLFNSCLMNKYRGGGDSIKAHRDSEEIFGENPVVVILTIGAPRKLTIRRVIYDEDNLHLVRPETDPELAHEFTVEMKHGSMLVMAGALQKYYSHEIMKVDGDSCGTRYSLTFRNFETRAI